MDIELRQLIDQDIYYFLQDTHLSRLVIINLAHW
jgi:hypothetical protein